MSIVRKPWVVYIYKRCREHRSLPTRTETQQLSVGTANAFAEILFVKEEN